MLPQIGWRRRALAGGALVAGGALLLVGAGAPAPLALGAATGPASAATAPTTMADHAARHLAAPMPMSMADHAAMLAAAAGSGSAAARADRSLIGGLPSTAGRIVTVDARPAETTMDGPEIDIQAFQFSLPALTVPVGTTVTWKNHDVEPHTVTSKQRAFGSTGLETDDVFAFRFDTPGTYEYYCALHPFMTAQVVVQ